MRRKLTAFGVCLVAAAAAQSASVRAASVDGAEIHSITAGSGPTIIFVHGWTCDTSSWREQMPAFDDDYRVIALDLPGHGLSESPAGAKLSMDLFARAIEAVRAEAGAGQVVLVGHSMGAPVIRQYAIRYPERVAGLVAVDGPLDLGVLGAVGQLPTPTPEVREAMIRGMFVPETPPALQQHILQMMLGASEATAAGAMAAMFDPSIRTDDVIDVPALVVVAGSNAVPDPASLRRVVPRAETAQVPGTGHFLMMEKPAEFNALLAGFLANIDY
jgi:sigma-B regulation protein RsbQ